MLMFLLCLCLISYVCIYVIITVCSCCTLCLSLVNKILNLESWNHNTIMFHVILTVSPLQSMFIFGPCRPWADICTRKNLHLIRMLHSKYKQRNCYFSKLKYVSTSGIVNSINNIRMS